MARDPGRSDEDGPEAIGATSGIPVVGLGGSAGALESFKAFFAAMPPDSGAAFVIIQHLSPTHQSLLAELLAQHTRMQVTEARDGAPVEPNCVYVIPPSHYLSIRDGVLYLAEPITEHGIRMPIDCFFRSLAKDRQERAICILLSGAGSDGTGGVRAVRGAGGLTIAQDQTAQFGDMPRSAVATGLVDLVLPPEQMVQALTDYLRQPYVRGGEPRVVLEFEDTPGGLNEILSTVLAQTGCDFRCYKKSTILRRIERRMGLHRISRIARYTDLLHRDANEINQLRNDLLINVTAFFRDAEAFEEFRLMVVVPLIAAKQTDDPLRVWVPGCSSGEEAYSLAMLLVEEMAASRKNWPVQMFATDIDEEALRVARAGVYPESIAADVGANRLAEFFSRSVHGYQVSELLRNSVLFAEQNLITDPPFSKLDIISCRNLLIYLDTETQAKLVPLFNFAINPGGYLFLGKSEGVSGRHDLFDTVSKTAKLYRRLTPARPIALDTPILPGRRRVMPTAGPAAGTPAVVSYTDSIRQVLLSHFAASVVLVDRKGQVLQFHGQTGKYLNMPTAEPSLNLLDIAKEGLSWGLRSAMHRAATEGKPVVMDSVPLVRDEGAPFVRVTVAPVVQRGITDPLLAVIFEDVPRPAAVGVEPARSADTEVVVRQLEDELRVTQQDLQSTIEELQASNEALRVANEEVVSSNEELQSTNEELETSKEELQSVNEELTTVNSQLQEKIERLDKAQADMANFLESAQIATLFLDGELRIKLFTPATTRVLKLIPSDTGRPISDLSMNFVDYDLTADAGAVAQHGSLIEREATHADGSVYLVRVLPYRSQMGRLDGVVVTFGDVTGLRRAERQTRRLATILRDSNDALILVGLEGDIQAWNRGAERMYGWSEAEALRMNIREMTPPGQAGEAADLMHRLLAGETTASFETQRRTRDGRVLDLWVTATAVCDEAGKVEAIATTERDITERKQADEALRQLNADLDRRVAEQTQEIHQTHQAVEAERQRLYDVLETLPVYVVLLSPDYHVPFANRFFRERFGESHGKRCYEYLFNRTEPCDICETYTVLKTNGTHHWEWSGPDGRNYDIYDFPFTDSDGSLLILEMGIDITERKKAEAELARHRQHLEELVKERTSQLTLAQESAAAGIWDWDMATGALTWSPMLFRLFGLDPEAAQPTLDSWRSAIHPEDRPVAEERIEQAIRNHTPLMSEYRIVLSTGEVRWINALGNPTYDEGGQARRMSGLCIDITERKRAEEDLRKLNRVLKTLSKSNQALTHARVESAYLRDVCRVIVEDCGHAMAWIGYAEEDEARSVRPVACAGLEEGYLETLKITWADTERGRGPTGTAIRTGRPCGCSNMQTDPRFEPWRAEAVKRGYASSMVLPLLADGKAFGALTIYSREPDPFSETEVRSLTELADDVANGITTIRARRAHAQAEANLREMAADLARSNKDLEHYAYVASHDLQEPLRQVTGYLGLLKKRYGEKLDATADEFINFAVDGAKRMSQLINDLLAYSRVTTRGRKPEPVDVSQVLRDVLVRMEFTIQDSGAVVTYDTLPTIAADATQLLQLFQNLIGNAIKFRGEEPPRIHVGVRRVDEMWQFSVSDNGIGMDAKHLDRIFLMFQRLHTHDRYPGTGIGLAICKKIVERHGGTIRVESKVGRGSTFLFTFPA